MTKPLSIGIITNAYPPNKNGVATAVYNLQKCLERKGCKVYIVTPKIPYQKYPENVCAVRSTPLPKSKTNDLRYPVNLLQKAQSFFKEHNVDIIHTHDTFMGGLEGIIAGFALQIPVVHTYHTLYEEYEYFSVPGYKPFVKSFSQIVCDSSSSIIALSAKVAHYLTSIGVTHPLSRLPNPISRDYYKTTSTPEEVKKVSSFFKKNHIDADMILISFGRIAQEKNIQTTIDIINSLSAKGKSVQCIIAGDGPELEKLQNEINNKGISDKILFFGRYNFGHLLELTKQCHGFICTSYSEVLPTTPLEAMLCKLPVFCVRDSAFLYIVKDGVNGVIGDREILEEILFQISDSQLEQLSEGAYNTATDYISQDFADQYISFYQSTIDTYKKTDKKTENMFLNSLLATQQYVLKLNQSIKSSLSNPRL